MALDRVAEFIRRGMYSGRISAEAGELLIGAAPSSTAGRFGGRRRWRP